MAVVKIWIFLLCLIVNVVAKADIETVGFWETVVAGPTQYEGTELAVNSTWVFDSNGDFAETLQVTNDQGLDIDYTGTGTWQNANGGFVLLGASSTNGQGAGDRFTIIGPCCDDNFQPTPLPDFNVDIASIAGTFSTGTLGFEYDDAHALGPISITLTSAPEIDAASAVAGLTLLLGGVVVLRGRRASNRVAA
jgi:hypothetical protein